MNILDIMTEAKLAPSRSEARRLIEGGAVFIGENKVASFKDNFKAEDLNEKIIRKGKKVHIKIII